MAAVAVIGGGGYTGGELLRYLVRHPQFTVAAVCGSSTAGESLDEVHPFLRGAKGLPKCITTFDAAEIAKQCELAFCALPHAASAPIVANLIARGVKVVDLSADFRLKDIEIYEKWYGAHPNKELLPQAVYGLCEFNRVRIKNASLVANPGCYPTAAQLSFLPLLQAGLRPKCIIVDAKSGVSGAGKKASSTTHFVEVGESMRPYKIARHHRHTPEIEQGAVEFGKVSPSVLFTPHLVPMSRGILSTCYIENPLAVDCQKLLVSAYKDEAFVHVVDQPPTTESVRYSNHAHLFSKHDDITGYTVVVAAIDNLGKGAAGQAIQSANLMFGISEQCGL